MKAEVVCDGVPFGEGPVWCEDGSLVVTSVAAGALYRVDPERGTAKRYAETGGGANGAAPARDGAIVVTQNGGFDFAATGLFDDPPAFRPATPGLQLARADGTVTYLADAGFQSPNDVAVAPDGTLWFTDPPHWPPPEPGVGRIWRIGTDGTVECAADGFWFCNGIGFGPDGTMIVVERSGLLRVHPDGERDWLVEHLGRGAGDGFCVDEDGRCYVASTVEHGIRVVDTDGSVVDFFALDGDGLTTNCCFGGADRRTLFATDALPGRVVAFPDLPTPGLPVPAWEVPASLLAQ